MVYYPLLARETKKVMMEKAEQCLCRSYAPISYKNNLKTKEEEIDLHADPYIRGLFESHALGAYSLSQVKEMAEEIVLKLKSGLIPKSFKERILRNPVYCGDFFWDTNCYKGNIRPSYQGNYGI